MIRTIKKWFSDVIENRKMINKKKKFMSCGNNLKLYGNPRIISPHNIIIGERVTLNDGCVLNATNSSIVLGNDIVISIDSKIIAASLDYNSFIFDNKRYHVKSKIYIGDKTWICAGAIILPGVKIKGNCVIAAGAVVTKDISETNVIVAGNPATIVKYFK